MFLGEKIGLFPNEYDSFLQSLAVFRVKNPTYEKIITSAPETV
jgi:hypothetical protein